MTVAHAGITQGLFSEEVAVLFRGEGIDLAAPEGEFPSPAVRLVRPDRESKKRHPAKRPGAYYGE